jgi:hypothetical protein
MGTSNREIDMCDAPSGGETEDVRAIRMPRMGSSRDVSVVTTNAATGGVMPVTGPARKVIRAGRTLE